MGIFLAYNYIFYVLLGIVFIWLFLIIMLNLPSSVLAQNINEGRITEHNVVSLVALSGLVTISYLVRKQRKNASKEK
jgi:hypothetical protein